jgi:hypothetical protein
MYSAIRKQRVKVRVAGAEIAVLSCSLLTGGRLRRRAGVMAELTARTCSRKHSRPPGRIRRISVSAASWSGTVHSTEQTIRLANCPAALRVSPRWGRPFSRAESEVLRTWAHTDRPSGAPPTAVSAAGDVQSGGSGLRSARWPVFADDHYIEDPLTSPSVVRHATPAARLMGVLILDCSCDASQDRQHHSTIGLPHHAVSPPDPCPRLPHHRVRILHCSASGAGRQPSGCQFPCAQGRQRIRSRIRQ